MANDVIHGPHQRTDTGIDNMKLGFWTFLSSECIFFACLLIAHLVFQHRFQNGPTSEIFNVPMTTVSTFVLLMSSLAMALAVYSAHHDQGRQARGWVLITAVMGLVFLGFQVFEFMTFINEGLTLDVSPFASSFYALTGFHGIHVAVGVLWLFTLWWTGRKGGLGRETAEAVELGGLYWHFVDIVWIVLFTVVYLLPSSA